MNFHQSFKKCSMLPRYQKITSNILKSNLEGTFRFSYERTREAAMYINLFWGFWCKFRKILTVSDKTIHEAFRIHKTLILNRINQIIFSENPQGFMDSYHFSNHSTLLCPLNFFIFSLVVRSRIWHMYFWMFECYHVHDVDTCIYECLNVWMLPCAWLSTWPNLWHRAQLWR